MLSAARKRLLLPGLTVAAAGGLLALGGCGGGSADVAAGKQLFTQRCGSCHALANAGTRGTIGPNLDDAFRQDVADGLGWDTIKGVVRDQIEVPQGGVMPAKLVTGSDADAIVSGGQTSKVSVDLKPGKYEFYCSVPGHEQAGMKGTLTVK